MRYLGRRHKYGAKPKVVDNIRFHSTKEANRYVELKLLYKTGHIHELQLQKCFPIELFGKHICNYIADFVYFDDKWKLWVEDCKGYRTTDYKIKKRLVEAMYNIKILET